MRLNIKDIDYVLPRNVVTNEDLQQENPHWNMKLVEPHSGVFRRYITSPDETALDLAFEACKKLLARHPGLKEKIDAIIFCTQCGDYIMPPNSCILHKLIGLPDEVFAFDFNLGCSGFIYGLAVSDGLLKAGIAENILLVTADTYSKYINKNDRSARVLFGDGAAVSWLRAELSGLIDIQCSTFGRGYEKFIIPAGGCRLPKSPRTSRAGTDSSGNVRTLENIYMSGMDILNVVKIKVPKQIYALLQRNQMTLDAIDLVIFHQASKIVLDSLAQILKLQPEKSYSNLREVGNTVSASIPIALKDALDSGKAKRGNKVLLVGFGVGMSYAASIVEV